MVSGHGVRPSEVSEVTMNMHEVGGWDMVLEVKMQLEVTHAP